jgi:hypothetical protein
MTASVWNEAPIGKQHDRAAFDCGPIRPASAAIALA